MNWKPSSHLFLALAVGAAIGLVVGYAQRSFGYRDYDLITWLTYDSAAIVWIILGALIFGALWQLFRSKS